MKVGKAGKAGPHAAYIAREGKYANRLDRGERLEATEAGNMPAWAASNPAAFWEAADAYERANGTTYREMEIALPRELSADQRRELVAGFVEQEIGDKHAYQWAIHVPTAADGGEQPHVHLMFSERQRDGIERDPEQYFKRANSKHPERGGCRKGYGPDAGKTKTRAERAAALKALRGRWEVACNAALEQAGEAERIDMRSYAEQGRAEEPERKRLPSEWRGKGKADVIEFRAAKAERREALADVRQEVPNIEAAVIDLEQAKARREIAALSPVAALRVAQDVQERIAADTRRKADRLAERIALQTQAIHTERERKHGAHAELRPVEPKGMLAGFKRKGYEKARAAWDATRQRITEWKAKRQRDLSSRWQRISGYLTQRPEGVQDRATQHAAERIKRDMPELAAQAQEGMREVIKQKEAAAARAVEQTRMARVRDDFVAMAAARERREQAFTGQRWKEEPEHLRRTIEGYNKIPPAHRAAALDKVFSDADAVRRLGDSIERSDAQERGRQTRAAQSRGPSLGR